ncbi:30S ribosomal protein S7 [Candidatus Dojkabacteria bacterium]|nr:30S ribosomal protein S7 [Candidatus Dojkabacteria bacterium]
MRGKKASKRTVEPDSMYGNTSVTRFINKVMLHGKKSLAENFVYSSMKAASEKLKKEPLEVLETALNNVKPALEVRSRRVGGANYQVPMPVPEDRQEALAIRWITDAARSKKGKEFTELLTTEIVNAYKGEGDAVKMKMDTEKMAQANKAFAHFRW